MSNASEQIPLTSLGLDAAQVLRGGARGTRAAIFCLVTDERSGRDWICFGDIAIGNGPLNALVPSMSFAHWRDRVAMADSIEITDIGDGGGAWHVRTHDVKIWRAPVCGPASPQRIRSRLEELPCRLPAGIPAEGLACFIWRPASPRSAVAQAAVPSSEPWRTGSRSRDAGSPAACPRRSLGSSDWGLASLPPATTSWRARLQPCLGSGDATKQMRCGG